MTATTEWLNFKKRVRSSLRIAPLDGSVFDLKKITYV